MLALRVRWAERRINDATAYKLERLYFGDPALLNVKGYYARTDWNAIRRALGFTTLQGMLNYVKSCGDFMMVNEDDGFTSRWLMAHSDESQGQNVDLFAAENGLGNAEEAGQNSAQNTAFRQNSAQSTTCSEQENCQKRVEASREARTVDSSLLTIGSINRGCQGEEEGDVESDEMNEGFGEKGASFFHWLRDEANEAGAEFIRSLKERFFVLDPTLQTDAEQQEMVDVLIDQFLIPYMDGRKDMLRRNRRGRLPWLRNLMKEGFGMNMCCQTLKKVREQHRIAYEASRRELDARRRVNRPISPYEYMDEASGTRLYDDPRHPVTLAAEPIRLPAYAPPRPSATAFWHPLRRQWKEEGAAIAMAE